MERSLPPSNPSAHTQGLSVIPGDQPTARTVYVTPSLAGPSIVACKPSAWAGARLAASSASAASSFFMRASALRCCRLFGVFAVSACRSSQAPRVLTSDLEPWSDCEGSRASFRLPLQPPRKLLATSAITPKSSPGRSFRGRLKGAPSRAPHAKAAHQESEMRPRPLRFAVLMVLALLFTSSLPAAAVTFVDSGASLLGAGGSIVHPVVAWGDYDGDNDLDLVVAGSTDGTTTGSRTRLYRNNAGAFSVQPTALPNLVNAALAWGDYDRDGDLDLALEGLDSTATRMTRIYRNDGGGTFVDIAAGLTAVANGGLAWGDFDNDG